MNATDHLIALAQGDRDGGLLPACRLEHDGCDYFGEERILAAFRRRPLDLGDPSRPVEARGHLAVITRGEAVFADLYGTHLGRLWRVGAPCPDSPEPAVAVAFDPDLRQARGDLLWRAQDHPGLDAGGHKRARAAAFALIDDAEERAGMLRVRVFLLRAFGDQGTGAALFAVHSMTSQDVRGHGFTYAIAIWRDAELDIVRDRPRTGERAGRHPVCIAR